MKKQKQRHSDTSPNEVICLASSISVAPAPGNSRLSWRLRENREKLWQPCRLRRVFCKCIDLTYPDQNLEGINTVIHSPLNVVHQVISGASDDHR